MRFLPEAQRKYEDLVRAVDVVVTKPGYGIVADVISHQVRVCIPTAVSLLNIRI